VIGALACGLARGALEHALRYAKERVQFGNPIGQFQGIGWMLSEVTGLFLATTARGGGKTACRI
jgi:alkylation response protein AidB-like acyl-CoA dehydrogenase